jgi:hypothetical protein
MCSRAARFMGAHDGASLVRGQQSGKGTGPAQPCGLLAPGAERVTLQLAWSGTTKAPAGTPFDTGHGLYRSCWSFRLNGRLCVSSAT